jgi:two-component system, NarL family, response regulator LiaR
MIDRDASSRTLRAALQEAEVTVIAGASDHREAFELTVYYKPDLVLVDLGGPGGTAVAATRELVRRLPGTKVVMLMSSAQDDDVGIQALRAGASGVLTRTVRREALARALRAAHDGETLVPRRMTGRLVEALRWTSETGAGIRPVRSSLTAREWEVLDLLCEGHSTDEIADALVLSSGTVRSHVKNVLRKLGVRSRGEAIAVARELRGSIMSGHAAA